jgi:hypothetical protein
MSARRQPDRDEVGPRLRERVYITFTGIAVLLTFSAHPAGSEAWTIVAALIVGVLGAVLAGFTADVISALAVDGRFPTRRRMAHVLGVSVTGLSTAVAPLLFLVAAGIGLLAVSTALIFAVGTMALGLASLAFVAVARAELPWWAKVAVFAGELVLVGLVIVVKLLAHA